MKPSPLRRTLARLMSVSFRFPSHVFAAGVAADLLELHPLAPPAVVRGDAVIVPEPLWLRPLVPELLLGRLGRLVEDPDSADDVEHCA
jgi:hypothetical protein